MAQPQCEKLHEGVFQTMPNTFWCSFEGMGSPISFEQSEVIFNSRTYFQKVWSCASIFKLKPSPPEEFLAIHQSKSLMEPLQAVSFIRSKVKSHVSYFSQKCALVFFNAALAFRHAAFQYQVEGQKKKEEGRKKEGRTKP